MMATLGSQKKLFIVFAIAAAVMALILGAWFLLRPAPPPAIIGKLTLALPTQINSASAIVAHAQGWFKKSGIEVLDQPFLLGKDALNSLLEGKADLAVVADTPFMFALLNGKDVAILAKISETRRSLVVVAQSDRGIDRVADLKNKTVGLTKGTNLTYFLDALLSVNAVPAGSVTQADMSVKEAIQAFKEKKVDAIVLFQPLVAQLEADMGKKLNVFYGEEVYAFRFLLVGKPAYIDSHPQEIQRVLRALGEANKSIRNNPVVARQQVGKVVLVSDAIMSQLFDPQDFVLELDQAMLLALDDQTRWAMKRGLVPAGPVPNYLNAIKYKNLKAVWPAAVKFAH
jgi:ABC-type nitrate/sulfonate/bicarbonate transport system substrate-binding protein